MHCREIRTERCIVTDVASDSSFKDRQTPTLLHSVGCSGGDVDAWSTSFTWRIENFSSLPSGVRLRSGSFEAGICTWWLEVYPDGCPIFWGVGDHLSVHLQPQNYMWEPIVEYKLTLVHQTDSRRSHSIEGTQKFDWFHSQAGDYKFIKASALRDAAAGWLVNDALVLKVDVTVGREERLQIDTGGVPCDMALQLPCGAEVPAFRNLLQLASPFFRGALEDMNGSAPIPVDGSLGSWTYIMTDLHQLPEPPALSLSGVYELLPVVHKYDFSRLLARLVAFIRLQRGRLLADPDHFETYVVRWLALAERLQLDELHELCLGRAPKLAPLYA
ncbi:hypothetical protein FOA52_013290 [Chlamydomonas sp. UWO 241]|nr:hypothetical protein FOA52_013290 [Chlamydomonas sp. UWO 241]